MFPVVEVLRGRFETRLARGSRWCIALSGGLDSSLLLHAMCALRGEHKAVELRAIHVDHGLQAAAKTWARHCEALCRKLDVELEIVTVTVDGDHPDGSEAAAREARYAAFRERIRSGEILLTAHHKDDQVETYLLRLLRGSGARGLAGIVEEQQFGAGTLVRPLLGLSRAALVESAHSAGIDWVDDPSNRDHSFDRNYLRHTVVPAISERWPGMGSTIGRAARLSFETAELLEVLAEADCRELWRGDAIDLDGFRCLDAPSQHNVIRHVLRRRGLPMPSETQLRTGLAQVLSARSDRHPQLHWGGAHLHRYRDRLFVLDFDPQRASSVLPDQYHWDGAGCIEMGPVRGRLRLIKAPAGGIAIPVPGEAGTDAGMVVRFRHGGERIHEARRDHHKSLKKLFQERGVVPWMRPHVPLLYGGAQDSANPAGRLLAVGDLWVAAEAMAAPGVPGYRVIWEDHADTL